jgi:hypothetical protein
MNFTKETAEKIKEYYSDFEGKQFKSLEGDVVIIHHLETEWRRENEYAVMVSCAIEADPCHLSIDEFLALRGEEINPELLN